MKEQEKINIGFYEPDEDAIPFVKVNIKGKDSKIIPALMIMDSGSNLNMLATDIRKLVGDIDLLPDESTEVVSITNQSSETPLANFCFEMDGKQFQEKFCFMEILNLMEYNGLLLVGILGSQFMQKYGLCIDYQNLTVRTSDLFEVSSKNIDIEYYIPIEYGLKYYNGPTIEIKGKKRDIVMLVDTGTDSLSISREAIEDNKLPYKHIGNNNTLNGPNGSVNVEGCEMELNIPVYYEEGIRELPFKETVMIFPQSISVTDDGECDEDGKPLSTIDGLLGSPFMAREKWILDFSKKAVYKYKS